MGKTDVYGKRTLVQAVLKIGANTVNYGFLTAVETTERQALGLTDVAGGSGTIVVGCNLPKPTRMMKYDSGYTVSSFVSTESISKALVAKWKIQKAGRRYRHTSSNSLESKKSVCAYVPVQLGNGSIKYAWRIPSYQAVKVTAEMLTTLGITIPASDTDASDMLFGVNNIKPAKAQRTLGGTDKKNDAAYTLTLPYDASKPLTDWTPVSGIRVKSSGVEF